MPARGGKADAHRALFLFDLDGTLVDSVYQHVLAWKEALDSEGIELSVWRIHRKIGMSGGLFTNQLLRETGIEMTEERVDRLRAARRSLSADVDPDPPAAGRARTAGLADPCGNPVGDRHQRPHGDGGGEPEALGVDPARRRW